MNLAELYTTPLDDPPPLVEQQASPARSPRSPRFNNVNSGQRTSPRGNNNNMLNITSLSSNPQPTGRIITTSGGGSGCITFEKFPLRLFTLLIKQFVIIFLFCGF